LTIFAIFILSFIFIPQAFGFGFRQLIHVSGYDRPGDYVGIYYWGYPSQLMGTVDYDCLLRGKKTILLFPVAIISSLLAAYFAIVAVCRKDRAFYPKLALALNLVIFLIPVSKFLLSGNLLLAWRSCLVLSTFVFLLVLQGMIIAVSKPSGTARQLSFTLPRFLSITIWPRSINRIMAITAAAALLLMVASVRLYMNQRIIKGTVHAWLFGNHFLALQSKIQEKLREGYDLVLLSYEGSGTKQAGLEWLFQSFPYGFAAHGSGVNEFTTDFFKTRKVLLVSDGSPGVEYFLGNISKTNKGVSKFGQFTLTDITLSPAIIHFSSTWMYHLGALPELTLTGMPGQILAWSPDATQARLTFQIRRQERRGLLHVFVNGEKVRAINVYSDGDQTKGVVDLVLPISLKSGLNIIKLVPVCDPIDDPLTQKVLAQLLSQHFHTEEESYCLRILRHQFPPVSPLTSPTALTKTRWNLHSPPDSPGYPPHVTFYLIKLEPLRGKSSDVAQPESR
jgi:hypothetical protein